MNLLIYNLKLFTRKKNKDILIQHKNILCGNFVDFNILSECYVQKYKNTKMQKYKNTKIQK